MQVPYLNRRAVVKLLLREREGLLVVAGLGASAWDVAATGDEPVDFPLWGAMGGATMVGFGLALAQPSRKVLVITGDGEMLMGLGSLATIGTQRPRNLRIVVLDNERYAETGQQHTHTASGTDLAMIALGCGFRYAHTVCDEDQIESLRTQIHNFEDLFLTVVKITLSDDPPSLPPRDGAYLKNRMRRALLGPRAI
jgi:thiamine pyrophosphate-dependent acetolactate synthase large subunit-like protein